MEENIITIRKKDISLAHEAFSGLMQNTEKIMNDLAKKAPQDFCKISPFELERRSLEAIKNACNNTPFSPDEINLISGHKFPDIVAEKYYGVEVKSTVSDSWQSTGSSIVESTRVAEVEDIYMLFGKLGGKVPEFKCRPYQDVLSEIAVTHSPRYMINMEIEANETIFSKMGTTYDAFRQSDDSIAQVRRYYRELAIQKKKQEMPWWITADNIEQPHSFNIRLWNTLDIAEKRDLQAKCMVLFLEALNPAKSSTKYNNISLWLCSYNQVVNPNIRDLYSAGGKITHVNGKKLSEPVPQVFNVIVEYAETIKAMLCKCTAELMMLIGDYNPALLKGYSLYDNWLSACCDIAKPYNIPLKKWIEEKPQFSFSNSK